MTHLSKLAFAILAAVFAMRQANAEGVVSQRIMSLPLAKAIAEGALSACQAKGFHTTVVVVDRAGQLMVVLRDEQAGPETPEMARRKAYTARIFHISSLDFQKRTMEPGFAAQRNAPDVLALGGGVPIKIGEEIIGAVASSGSNQESDDACAKAGIAKVSDQLK
jgi:uncharacterized protein GlcG (DUF336 family)